MQKRVSGEMSGDKLKDGGVRPKRICESGFEGGSEILLRNTQNRKN